jgi:hypothetical protein
MNQVNALIIFSQPPVKDQGVHILTPILFLKELALTVFVSIDIKEILNLGLWLIYTRKILIT